MTVWEITNPSDPYTIESDSFLAAAAATLLVGEGRMGLEPQCEDDPGMPLFLFGGHESFVDEHFGGDLGAWIDAHPAEIADALDSVLLGGFDRRSDFASAMEAIDDPAKRLLFREKWQDKRSSMSDIGGYAYRLAEHFRERAATAEELRWVTAGRQAYADREPCSPPGDATEGHAIAWTDGWEQAREASETGR